MSQAPLTNISIDRHLEAECSPPSVNVGAVRVEQEGDGMGDLAGLRGLYLTDLRQTRLETALHLAERVGPDDPARAQASAPGQPASAAPRRGGDLPGRPDLSAVWRL